MKSKVETQLVKLLVKEKNKIIIRTEAMDSKRGEQDNSVNS
jgi:hypothetical protein